MPSPENTAASFADLQRLLHNLIRVGSIHAVDLASTPARVRVLLSAEDETAGGQLITDWRPYFERRAGTTSTWNPPTVGEQCAVISPGGDLAACLVLVGLHSTRNPAPIASPTRAIKAVNKERARKGLALVAPFGFRDLKGKGATDMWLNRTPIEQIQLLCGHADKATTEKYIKARWNATADPNGSVVLAADGSR